MFALMWIVVTGSDHPSQELVKAIGEPCRWLFNNVHILVHRIETRKGIELM